MTVLKRNELSSKQKPCFFFLYLSLWRDWQVSIDIYRKRFHHVYFCFFSVSWSPTNSLVSWHPLIQFSLANSVNYCTFWIIIYLIWKKNIVAAYWSIFFFIESIDFFFFCRVNNYQLYTRRRLAETPKPSFKDIGQAWKSLSEAEKKHYQEEAEKVGVS